MPKTFWQRKQNHLLMMVICCLIPLVLIIVFVSLFKGNNNYWFWLIVLFCLLMHIFMMRGHGHNNSGENKTNNESDILYKCEECGLEYKEKEWEEKCEEWCRQHKSCNLEIIKHAVKKEEEKQIKEK